MKNFINSKYAMKISATFGFLVLFGLYNFIPFFHSFAGVTLLVLLAFGMIDHLRWWVALITTIITGFGYAIFNIEYNWVAYAIIAILAVKVMPLFRRKLYFAKHGVYPPTYFGRYTYTDKQNHSWQSFYKNSDTSHRQSSEKTVKQSVKPDIIHENDFDTFINNALSMKDVMEYKQLGKVVIGPAGENTRPCGAYAILSHSLVDERRQKINSGEIKRNDEDRKNAHVAGFETTNKKYIDTKNHGRQYLWHRTHFMPFRYTLSENENGLLFAGTANLNHGDRPQYDFYMNEHTEDWDIFSSYNRKMLLFRQLTSYTEKHDELGNPTGYYYKTKRSNFDPELIPYSLANGAFPKNDSERRIQTLLESARTESNQPNVNKLLASSTFSLDDIEQFVDTMMNVKGRKNHIFKYSVVSYDQTSEQNLGSKAIPGAIRAILFDLTESEKVFDIKIPNQF